jgi:uncharacterized protein YcgL (UPF0745 family)
MYIKRRKIMTKLICEIYRCAKKEGMYVYVDKEDGVDKLPEALKKRTGRLILAMTLVISPGKKLARAKSEDVLIAIENQGFFLQMPPSPSDDMQGIGEKNSLIRR